MAHTIIHLKNLHSTIFILKPKNTNILTSESNTTFTFYYIYIKTEVVKQMIIDVFDLHSTIFILKLYTNWMTQNSLNLFTFYYIYIKTKDKQKF